jgi:hypothetical protein
VGCGYPFNKRGCDCLRARCLLRAAIFDCHLADDALHQHYADVNVPGNIGQEFGDEIVSRRNRKADTVTLGAGAEVGLLSRRSVHG